jgi:ferric-dicitrate binding protein FerR (iron transport regulator)
MSNVVNGVAAVKRANITVAVFIAEWLKEHKNEGNYTALAERLGLKPASAYQRAQNLNRQLKAEGHATLPSLPEKPRNENRRRLDLNSISALIALGMTSENEDETDPEGDDVEGETTGITGPVEL